jgi:hypothetical protein
MTMERTHWLVREPIVLFLIAGLCDGLGPAKDFKKTRSYSSALTAITPSQACHTPQSIVLKNGDVCAAGDWIVRGDKHRNKSVVRVVEIMQLVGSKAASDGQANWILVQLGIVGTPHDIYGMPKIHLSEALEVIDSDDVMVCRRSYFTRQALISQG